jgi:hypothetical protein
MKNEQEIYLDFYDAVMANNAIEVGEFLEMSNIPIRIITGSLIIALENKLLDSSRAILAHNNYAQKKIADKHLNNILYFAAKHDLLKELQITYH